MPELTDEEMHLLRQLSERERIVSGPQRPRGIQRLVAEMPRLDPCSASSSRAAMSGSSRAEKADEAALSLGPGIRSRISVWRAAGAGPKYPCLGSRWEKPKDASNVADN